jgi:hypothetical protein
VEVRYGDAGLGFTSGVVYPGLVCKLAEYYDFQNIGTVDICCMLSIAQILPQALSLGEQRANQRADIGGVSDRASLDISGALP